MKSLLAGLAAATLGCSSQGGAASDAGSSPDASSGSDGGALVDDADAPPPEAAVSYPAPHPAAPQVRNEGGPVMASPRFVPIYFPNDAHREKLDDFLGALGESAYWVATTREYGVGPASKGASIVLTEAAPATIDDPGIQAWLTSKIGHDPAFGSPDDNTVFIVYYPSSTVVTNAGLGGSSCKDFGAYHYDFSLPSGEIVSYVVIPLCPARGSLSELDVLTADSSHEIIETATDPQPSTHPAFRHLDDDHAAFKALHAGEICDLCDLRADAYFKPDGFSYMVERCWSNRVAAASEGHDPCVPAAGGAYFNSAPVLPDVSGRGISVRVGETSTVELELFSDGPTTGPWTVYAQDVDEWVFGQKGSLSISPATALGQNGDKVELAITARTPGLHGFIVVNELGDHDSYWVGMVSSQ